MLGKKLVMKDIESIDPEFYNSLKWIKYFIFSFKVFQFFNTHDLCFQRKLCR